MRRTIHKSLITSALTQINVRYHCVLAILTFTLSLLITSCTHKDLCYDHSHVVDVNVEFVWSKAPVTTPASMSVYLFSTKSNRSLRFEFTDPKGGRIRLEAGTYRAICLNSDTRYLSIKNRDDFGSFCITSKEATSMYGLSTYGITPSNIPKGSVNERALISPELTYTHSIAEITLNESNSTIVFHPECVTRNYTVEIRNVPNLKWVYGVSGTISSMAEGIYPSTFALSETCATIPFECYMDKDNGIIHGTFTSFGHCPTIQQKHELIIYAVLADDSKWYYQYDVTDQIHNAEDPFETYILLDELPIPKPVANGGGFKPTVGEWNSVEIVIPM